MDTVRADHTSLCGYARPTTPTLAAMAARGLWSCDAVAPGSWTLPSHASYFTGLEVQEHGAHFAASSPGAIRGMHMAPLGDDAPTLAEDFVAHGYQTFGASGNPVLVPASGLARGFQRWSVAARFGGGSGESVLDNVRAGLAAADRSKPLFLFVNIADAHDPWIQVPEGLGWVAPRTDGLHYFSSDAPGEWEAYVGGELSDVEEGALRERVTDLYDVGVRRADDVLARLMTMLRARGWMADGTRVVVVSDHGEYLGEHQLLRHGRYLWEPNNRVPLVAFTEGETPPSGTLPAPVNARVVTELVRRGQVTDAGPVRASAYPDAFWLKRSGGRVGGSTSAAWWEGDQKWVWMDGDVVRYDLTQDPGEGSPLPPGVPPEGLDAFVGAVRASGVQSGAGDADMLRALQAAGYVDGP